MSNSDEQRRDAELVRRFREGDERAFSKLIALYRDPLLTLVNAVVKEYDAADSAVHRTFVNAWKNLHKFRVERSFRKWICKIALNAARTSLKKQLQALKNVRIDE